MISHREEKTVDRLDSNLHTVEEKISILDDIAIVSQQNKAQREND